MGLFSDGGVHSHNEQLYALLKLAKKHDIKDVFVHALTDGRDTDPKAGLRYAQEFQEQADKIGTGELASIIGRYYAMDRDKRWDRTKLAWDAIVDGKGEHKSVLASEAVGEKYNEEKTDEFLHPIVFDEAGKRRINDGDVVIFFNFRADRARQLSEVFLKEDFDGFETNGVPKVEFVTLTEYDETYHCPVAFPPESLANVLGEVVAAAGKNQMRIAETEKYPHVTYFFNGGVEKEFSGEDRFIIPSPKEVATYDEKPEMSAAEVIKTVVENLKDYDLVILNFANPDMVGHTGVIEAAKKAVETIDEGVKRVVEETLKLGGQLLITADHGNCEFMKNADGSPHTAHTTNLVHAIYVGENADRIYVGDGILADVAPTLLDMLGVRPPKEMTGRSLLMKG
jgi:2,3-bisphosphoglycerate-independent phosphoglycerate mutase